MTDKIKITSDATVIIGGEEVECTPSDMRMEMGDLQRYILARKSGDPEFAKDFDEGFEEFKTKETAPDDTQQVVVKVIDVINSSRCVDAGDADKLREHLESLTQKNETIRISFYGATEVSPSFLWGTFESFYDDEERRRKLRTLRWSYAIGLHYLRVDDAPPEIEQDWTPSELRELKSESEKG